MVMELQVGLVMDMIRGHKGLLHCIRCRINDHGHIWIVSICAKKFEVDACYVGPSNEMTCDG
jgi:hypothetical protein